MADIKKIGAKALKDNPTAKKVFVTSDGFTFLNENSANLHATTNASKKTLMVSEFSKTGKDEEPDRGKKGKKLSAPEKAKLRVEAISKLETVEAVNKALEGETAKTVKKAGETRKKELELLKKTGSQDPATRGAEITEGDVKNSISDNEDANTNPTKEEE